MLYYNLKTAFRQIYKNKGFALINILGLAVGLACGFLILLYVVTELSYDRHYKDARNIYRLAVKSSMGENQFEAAVTGGPLAQTLQTELPEVTAHTRLREGKMTLLSFGDKAFYEENILYADSTFFELFNYELLKGNSTDVLKNPRSLVLSEKLAEKFFGNENPIGQQIKWNNEENYTVTAVFKKSANKSHLNFDILVSFSTLYQNEHFKQLLQSYFAYTTLNYIKVHEGTDPAALEVKIADVVTKYMGDGLAEYDGKYDVFLQPLTRIYLHSDLLHEMKTSSDIIFIYIFSGVAILILLIAAINFINLATARSLNRSLEVGLRKVFGSDRGMLFRQFMGESGLTITFSLILSLFLFYISLPLFNNLTGNNFQPFQIINWEFLVVIILGITVIGFLSATYPSLYLSRFNPIGVLSKNVAGGKKKSYFRNILVVFQFLISVFLVSGTILIYRQLEYMQNKNLGVEKENIVVISLRNKKMTSNYESLKAELSGLPGVINITGSSAYLGNLQQRMGFFAEGQGLDDMVLTLFMQTDQNYLEFFKTKIILGRGFFENSLADSNAIVINESYKTRLGWENPIGKHIFIPGQTIEESTPLKIVGVVENFHYASLHEEVKPLIIMNAPERTLYLSLKINPENQAEIISLINSKWEELFPGFPFEYFMQQSKYEEMYRNEVNMGRLFIYFSILALFIAALGLLGLSSYLAEKRTKEIGIRKVLGSSVKEIIVLVTKDFSKWVIIAIILATPLTYLVMENWLGNFAFRTHISWTIFLFSGIVAFSCAYITILSQALRVSRNNPLDALKYE